MKIGVVVKDEETFQRWKRKWPSLAEFATKIQYTEDYQGMEFQSIFIEECPQFTAKELEAIRSRKR